MRPMAKPLTHLSTVLSDRYRIERELGAGGIATVYLAQDIKHDRKVAIRVLRPELFHRRATPRGPELVAATLQLGAEPRVLTRAVAR
jgi:serine/threonine protein kinase